MKYIVLGYTYDAAMLDVTEADVKKLTHMNLAFGLIKDGLLDLSRMSNWDYIQNYRVWNPDLKVVLSVGGWGAGGFSTMAMTDEGRRAFAASCLDVVNRYGLDGIPAQTQHEIAPKLNISRSYVSRIEKKALEKLRAKLE